MNFVGDAPKPAAQGKGKGKGKGERKPIAEAEPQFKARIQCKFCHKTGHYEDRCWAKQKEERKAKKGSHPPKAPQKAENRQKSEPQDESKKRKYETISFLKPWTSTMYLDTKIGGRDVSPVIDTGATVSALALKFAHGMEVQRDKAVPVRMGDGNLVYSHGSVDVEVNVGRHAIPVRMLVLETTAFDAVLGMDFLDHPMVNGILFKPARRVIEDEMIPLREDRQQARVGAMFRIFNTESYKLIPSVRRNALRELGVKETSVRIDLFASDLNAQEALYCTKSN